MVYSKKRVLIVGAGYTGLAAAIELLKADCEVVVIDKATAGGLAADFRMEGQRLEKAYHHFFKTDYQLLTLAKELGLMDKIIWLKSSMALIYQNKLWPFAGAIDLLKFKPLSVVNRFRAGVVVLFLQRYKNWQKLAGLSAADWMLRAAGKQVFEVIWRPLLVGKFSQKYYKQISMAWLWARVHIRAQSRDPQGEMLGYFDGGFAILTEAMIAKVTQSGGKLVCDVGITEIILRSKTYKIVLSNGQEIEVDDVLFTIPSDAVAKIIQPLAGTPEQHDYVTALQRVEYVGAICMVFSSDQSLSRFYWHNVNDDAPFLAFIQHTNLVSKQNYQGKEIYYLAAYLPNDHHQFRLSDKDLTELWFNYLKKIFPHFDEAKISQKSIHRFDRAQHLAFMNYQKIIAAHCAPFEGMFVANFAQIYPEDRGTNYAIAAGQDLAKIIVKN